jgi:hypothetical protein
MKNIQNELYLQCNAQEKCNNKTMVKMWRHDIIYDNVLHFISDAVPYMLKVGQTSVVCPKMTHFACLMHAFHLTAEVARDNYPKVDLLIS